jgi:2-polyprenyl-3-methyl-5-hydroxy-6-metoxy-1,4-benzoquinol methylase
LDEINRVEHPFKREMEARAAGRAAHGFDRAYFDDPDALTGFRGYSEEGNSAEGRRDFRAEALDVIAALRALPPSDGREVLDVGCAKGFLVRHLRSLGIDAWGCDISEYAIARAPDDVREHVWVARVEDLPTTVRYRVVHVCGVLIYLTVSEIRAALQRFAELGAEVIVSYEPTLEKLTAWWDARDEGAFDPLRKQELPEATWRALFAEAGWTWDPRGFYRR